MVYVEQWLIDKLKEYQNENKNVDLRIEDLYIFSIKNDDELKTIKYLITLGGDGTILYAAKQFHGDYIPPIISFTMGSLSYLCNFDFNDHQTVITNILFNSFKGDQTKDPCLDLRMRLKIEVSDNPMRKIYKGGQLENYEEILIQNYHVINEIVIDRGPSPYCVQVEIFIDNNYFTTLVGDGLIISTPTGSTAYNLAAGGSIMQSNVPAISLTPLAPHSLSFRPLILPENIEIKLRKPQDGRTSAWVSLDGATRFELKDDESVTVRASTHAVAFITNPVDNLTALWSQRLTKLLNWNCRPQMKSLKKISSDEEPK
ncbi:nad kinase-like [Stylonychia lemnae]|uniref:Nad kinase-like n=1 Tax=Stylonychia lemnae TaxID=5949 RepID=A0A078ARR4_STYLE|nr:nad kinase-like [Stylonychia lemnae]|eukprot:CDW83877.1 nad kinase-like [Stylonychia lemnae]